MLCEKDVGSDWRGKRVRGTDRRCRKWNGDMLHSLQLMLVLELEEECLDGEVDSDWVIHHVGYCYCLLWSSCHLKPQHLQVHSGNCIMPAINE